MIVSIQDTIVLDKFIRKTEMERERERLMYLGRRGVGGALGWHDPRNELSGTVHDKSKVKDKFTIQHLFFESGPGHLLPRTHVHVVVTKITRSRVLGICVC